ncbi:MAG: response regulator [Clostridia bacterium]|nr:response regulator [Clostridia bacterium]
MYRLVIVDDEYYTLEGMKRILDWDKYNISIVGTATDGISGLDVIRSKGADIVIVDIRMQEMDGLEMISILRKEQFKGKIIILSGYQSFEYAKSAIDFKVDKYLTKPVNPAEFEESIIKIIRELQEENGDIAEGLPDNFRRILEEIDRHYTENIQLTKLAEQFYCSSAYLSRMFKKYVGMNYVDYITKKRIEKAKEMLKRQDMSIDEIMIAVGWQDPKHFRAMFKKQEGISPSEFRRRNQKL